MGQSGDAAKGQAVAQLAGVYKLSSREGEGRQRAAEPVGIPVGYTSESRRTHARSARSRLPRRGLRVRVRVCVGSHKEMAHLYVASAQSRGRGLFTSRACPADERLCAGTPLCAMQAPANPLACCAWCGTFVGPIEQQLAMVAEVDVADIVKLPAVKGASSRAAQAISCARECGLLYCTERCRASHAEVGGHSMLCSGTGSGEAALEHASLLEMAAQSDAGLFLPLAASVVSTIVAEATVVASPSQSGRIVSEAVALLNEMAAGGVWARICDQEVFSGHFEEDFPQDPSSDDGHHHDDEDDIVSTLAVSQAGASNHPSPPSARRTAPCGTSLRGARWNPLDAGARMACAPRVLRSAPSPL